MMAPTAIERHNNQINDTDLNEFLFQSSFEKTNLWGVQSRTDACHMLLDQNKKIKILYGT
jgi:hypothetical protein